MKTERKPKGRPMGAWIFLSASLYGFDQGADKNVRAPWGWRTGMSALRMAALLAALATAGLRAWAATSAADSNIITVDTRGAQSGTLTGLVQGNGTLLANAQVRIDATPFTTSTDVNGRFTLTAVPAGSGYLLMVSAAGFASKSVSGITVTAETTDLGIIALGTTTGPYQITPLAPDVNPATTTVEQGGTAYRYYVMQNSAGHPQGGVAVSVQVAGGSEIPQAQDVSSYWPGQVAGTSDADGIVRIAIPASALGAPGTVQTIQLSLSGQVQQTFKAQAVPRQYDQVWKQVLGGGVSVGELLTAEADMSAESDLRHQMSNGTVVGETISRIRQAKLKAGVGFDVGASFAAQLSAGAGVSVGTTLSSTYTFIPNTTDSSQNAMKLYVDLGNVLSGLPGPASAFYNFVDTTIAPSFLGPNLTDVEADVQAGLYADATLDLGLPLGKKTEIGVQGSASASADVIYGYEQTFGDANESASVKGLVTTVTADLSAQLGFTPAGASKQNNLAYSLFSVGLAAEKTVKQWTKQGQSAPYRSETNQQVSLQAGSQIPVVAWQQYDSGSLLQTCERDFTETVQAMNGNPLAAYSWSVYAGQNFGLSPSLSLGVLGVNVQGELDHGAEAVNQRGTLWQTRYWPTESYPAVTTDLFPTQSWASLLSQWGTYAAGPIGKGIQWIATTVDNAAGTVVHVTQQVGTETYNAVLSVGNGALADGSQVISSVSSSLSSFWHSLSLPNSPLGLPGGPKPMDATRANLVYGVGGVYRFQCTNSFNGTATLTISYSSGDVAGLNPADLRMYYLPDGTNRWQLVGGTVNLASNTVSATITNLGTYAAAPPLPTGDLQLVASTNLLSADGASQMTITITNVLLNTGNAATQQWEFTATASGVTILNQDADASTPGVQVYSTNGAITLKLLAPQGGNIAHVSLASVAGDAFGSTAINLLDNTAPGTPSGVSVTAGQSRIWVSWQTNSEPDTAGYRVYYRLGQVGPPWDGTAAVEGAASPVMLNGTNWLLRGLLPGTNYFVAVSAVDTTGNESPLTTPIQVTTTPAAPAPPTGVAVRFGPDRTNILMWALSEDDGYNDRDVARYDVFRAVLPGGNYVKVGEASAGVGLYTETNTTVGSTQYVGYAVAAVATNDLSSSQTLASRLMADGVTIDNDGDGIPDWWLINYFGHPTGQASDQSFAWSDPAGDGLSNLQKYLLGRNPLVWDNLHFIGCQYLADGRLRLSVFGQVGHNYTLLASTNLANWVPVLSFACTNGVMDVFDPDAKNLSSRFYRLAPPAAVPGLKLGLGSAQPLSSNGLDLVLFSSPGLEYRIDASSDLLNWTAVTNFISTNATMRFMDSSATNYSRRFYRAVVP
jgi:Carboxypeptidase regulatory-like domain